jgi:hypothetical protein
MSYITHLTSIFSVFVIVLQLLEFFMSYSRVVYGNEQIKNPILSWLVVEFGFFITYLLTRGLLIFLFCLFLYFFPPSVFTILICVVLIVIYSCIVAK